MSSVMSLGPTRKFSPLVRFLLLPLRSVSHRFVVYLSLLIGFSPFYHLFRSIPLFLMSALSNDPSDVSVSPYFFTHQNSNPFPWFVVGRRLFSILFWLFGPTNHLINSSNCLNMTVKKHDNIHPPRIISTRLGGYSPAQAGWILQIGGLTTRLNIG
jgi:hypothetical protein